MELAEQYWNLKGEVANLLNAIRELSNDSIDNSFNANNAEQDELEVHIDELLRGVVIFSENEKRPAVRELLKNCFEHFFDDDYEFEILAEA